jgi:hypothetical protein
VVFYLQSPSIANVDDVDYVMKDGAVTLKGTIDNQSHMVRDRERSGKDPWRENHGCERDGSQDL